MKSINGILNLITSSASGAIVGATDRQIIQFQEHANFELPLILRQWLKHCNGSLAGQGGIFGVDQERKCLDIEWIWSLTEESIG